MDWEKPKNREEAKAEIRRCARDTSNFSTVLFSIALLFAALGVIGDVLGMTLGLESMSWFMLAIFVVLMTFSPHLHVLICKYLFDIETE